MKLFSHWGKTVIEPLIEKEQNDREAADLGDLVPSHVDGDGNVVAGDKTIFDVHAWPYEANS